MIVKCQGCGIDFEAERKSARFHSPACKMEFRRKSLKARVSEVTDEILNKGLPDAILGTPPTLVSAEGEIDKDNLHRTTYPALVPEMKDDIEIPTPPKKIAPTTNNWEKAGFTSKDKAMLYAIALTVKNVPGASVSWKGRFWTKEDFSKGILDAVKELV